MHATTEAQPHTLQSLFRAADAGHRQNLCVLALLTWVASCDGTIDDEELELLRTVAAGVPGGRAVLPAVIDVARLGRSEDLELACRYVRNNATRADRPLLAQLFVTMAAQDGRLTVAEEHVLRFLADLLGLGARKFARLFEEVTHRPFPEAGDVSSVEWWQRREAGEEAQPPADKWGADRPPRPSAAQTSATSDPNASANGATAGRATAGGAAPPPPTKAPITRDAALRMFGLSDGATKDEIHTAYRRLAKARHPDRYARLGPAAQATATAAFTRVQEAYAVLSADA
jgi:DnaJ like chaperone protein